MSKYSDVGLDKPSSGPHKDYNTNLSQANKFCSNVKKSLLSGMSVRVGDSDGLKNSLLMISYIPEKTSKMGNFVTPVCLHQSASDFSKKVEEVFNSYLGMVKRIHDIVQGKLFNE